MLANTVEAGVEVRLRLQGAGDMDEDGGGDLGVIHLLLLLPLSALPPQALNLDKWVGLALGVFPITPDPTRPAAQAHILNTGAGGYPPPQMSGAVEPRTSQAGRKEGRRGF